MAVETPLSTREIPAPRGIVSVLATVGISVALMQTLIVPILPRCRCSSARHPRTRPGP